MSRCKNAETRIFYENISDRTEYTQSVITNAMTDDVIQKIQPGKPFNLENVSRYFPDSPVWRIWNVFGER